MSSSNLPPPTTRAELLERIRSSSKQEVVLSEMQRLGFWPASDGEPTIQESLIAREAELAKELRELGNQMQRLRDPQAALKDMRKERMAKARAKREETRQKRARERFERASAWQDRRASELLYLGEGVSAGLSETHADLDKLARLQLPPMEQAQQLATAMGISLEELRFLAFERRVSRISHYRRFALPKKTGGERIISAPMPRLKRAQYWILDNVLACAPVHGAAHGFLKGRSIVSNALPHVGKDVVINIDLKNFFPSIGMPRIKGVFRELGYSEQIATTLALLCTEASTQEVSVDGETFFVAHGTRALPQGAPSSPALTNILCRRLDARLQGAAAKLGFAYTRYADDLTFSGDASASKLAGKMLWRARQIVASEGFTPHPEKQHVMRSAQRQSVTGIVVNQKPAIERDTLRRFRATLYQIEKDGPEGKQWNGNSNVIDALEGYAHFIRMVDAEKGAPLLQRVRAVRERWAATSTVKTFGNEANRRSAFRALSAQGKAPWEGWWQPARPAAPLLEKTAIQVKEEKREEKAQERAKQKAAAPRRQQEQRAANNGAAPARTPAEASRRPPRGFFAGRPWGALALQLVIAAFVSIGLGSVIPMLVAIALCINSLIDFNAHWLRFMFTMSVLSLISKLLR